MKVISKCQLSKKKLPGDLHSYISIFTVSFLSSQFGGRRAKVWKWKQLGISFPVAQGGGVGKLSLIFNFLILFFYYFFFQLLDSSLNLLNIAHVLSIVNLPEMKQILE